MSKARQALYLIVSLLVIIADQLLKNYIVTNFKIGDERPLFLVSFHLHIYKTMEQLGISSVDKWFYFI